MFISSQGGMWVCAGFGREGKGLCCVCVYNIDLPVKNQTGGKRNLVGNKENVLLYCPVYQMAYQISIYR